MYKLSTGSTRQVGTVKHSNTSKAVQSMEPCAMFWFRQKLYIRDYCDQTTAFKVFDAWTLELDQELTDKCRQLFENVQKTIENDEVHRSLLWHKCTKSGRSLELSPLFSCD